MKSYSRLAFLEEKRNMKKAYLYIIFSVLALIFLVFLGLPLLIRFSGFLGDLGKSNKPVEINDNTPPAPPQFDLIPEYTNIENLDINGTSENGAVITIRANNEESEVVANNEGRFTFVFNLLKGENKIDALAKDTSGNVSNSTKVYSITFDNSDPEITIDSPKEGTTFYGSNQRQAAIKGGISESVNLTINEKLVAVKDDGSFSFATTLNEGINTFELKAVDPSGNETKTSISINFVP